MLEAIADFWKPIKKGAIQNKPKLADLQLGSLVSFGYMPQAALSGKKLFITAVNRYQFGTDILTSFVLSPKNSQNNPDTEDYSPTISMIIADAQGEQYLAISRKISPSERSKLFPEDSIANITGKTDASKLTCLDNVPELKGWLVSNYKREIQGMRGFLHNGEQQDEKLDSGAEFSYTLLGSDSSEHALEIEKYNDGRVEVYATIYRRTADINNISHDPALDAKTTENQGNSASVSRALVASASSEMQFPVLVKQETIPEKEEVKEKAEEKVLSINTESPDDNKVEAVAESNTENAEPEHLAKEIKKEPPKIEIIAEKKEAQAEQATEITITTEYKPVTEEKETMIPSLSSGTQTVANGHDYNGVANLEKANGKAITGIDGESISCDLKVANQIIEEAIRNEMRLSDVVRRIIELPVAHQESVQIPITLSDEDYALLAIRYSVPASDKNAIKTRIIQDLGDFSGDKRK